jgi:CubicO group peptidase (beta-lactamase class C family)
MFTKPNTGSGERGRELHGRFVSTPARAWVADKRPIYGAFFWINGAGQYRSRETHIYMAGAGGQTTMIVPSHDLVVVRLGHYWGETAGPGAFQKALTLLMAAVPRRN